MKLSRTTAGPSRPRALALLFILCGACAAPSVDELEPTASAEAEVTTASPTWTAPACAPDSLTSPASECDGPWKYSWSQTCTSHQLCGDTNVCTTYNLCPNWSDVVFTAGTATSTYDTGCHKLCTSHNCGCSPPSGQPKCSAALTSKKAALHAQVSSALPAAIAARVNAAIDASTSSLRIVGTVTDHSEPSDIFVTTTWECRLDFPSAWSQVTTRDPSCSCQEYQAKTCVCASDTVVTAPGLPVPASPGAGRAFTVAPVCLTCDQLPYDTAMAAQAKFKCLADQLPATDPDLARALTARMKLLGVLAGERLSAAQHAQVLQLYADPAGLSCSAPVAVPTACSQDAAGSSVATRLQECRDVLGAGTTVGSAGVRAVLTDCLGALADAGQLATTCRAALRDPANDLAGQALARLTPAFSDTSLLDADVLAFLRLLDGWYDAAASAAGPDRPWLQAQTSGLLALLWDKVQKLAMPLPNGIPDGQDAQAATLLADVGDVGFQNDFRMLRLAFDASRPLDSTPLLVLVADTLRASTERLAQLAPIHDAACRFRGCKVGGQAARATALSELAALIAATPDRAALATAITLATHVRAQHPEVMAAFELLRDQHAALEAAWAQLGLEAPLAGLATLEQELPAEAQELAAEVRGAAVLSRSYQATGFFGDVSRQLLSSAVLKQEQLVGTLDTLVGALEAARRAFTDARLAAVNDLLGQIQGASESNSVTTRLDTASAHLVDLAGHLDALAEREHDERAALGRYLSGFEALVASGALDPTTAYQVRHPLGDPIAISARDAKHVRGVSVTDLQRESVTQVALQPAETLHLRVSGMWAPDCALRLSSVSYPDGHPGPIHVDQPTTGPEGYWMQWTNSGYSAKGSSVTDTDFNSFTSTAQGCVGFMYYGSGVSECMSWSDGNNHSTTDTSSSGSESRVSASFSSGLRLPGTPFPRAPVGALLAVVVAHDDPYHFLDVRVVGRDEAIVAPPVTAQHSGPFDVYLIVNDVVPGATEGSIACAPRSDDALHVEVTVVTPLGDVAKDVGQAMDAAVAEMEAQAPAILRQGELMPEESSALRASAWVELENQLAVHQLGLTGLPLELHNYFDAWIERQLASLARRATISRSERESRDLTAELDSLLRERTYAQGKSRLLRLVPRWRLRDLQGQELASSVRALAEALVWHAAPIFELRDPARLSSLRTALGAQLDSVLAMDFAGRLEDTIAGFSNLATAVRSTLAIASFELPSTSRRVVVLAYPRAQPTCDPEDPICDDDGFRMASEAASRALWAGLDEPDHVARFEVDPADLYAAAGGASRLTCLDQAPVIRRMSLLVLSNNALKLQDFGYELPGLAAHGASLDFLTSRGTMSFQAADPGGVPLVIPALSDTVDSNLLTDFGVSPELGAGAGLSPFTRFEVDLSDLYRPAVRSLMTSATTIFLIFELERRVGSQVVLPGMCAASPSP